MEKDVERSKKELEEARQKIALYEKSNSNDSSTKAKLESDYKKKCAALEAKLQVYVQKEADFKKISSYQEKNNRQAKDLDSWIARMRNQRDEMERRLKTGRHCLYFSLYARKLRMHWPCFYIITVWI